MKTMNNQHAINHILRAREILSSKMDNESAQRVMQKAVLEIACDAATPGGVRHNELLCEKLSNDEYKCYLPNAACDRWSVYVTQNVEASNMIDEDTYVRTRDGMYRVSAVRPSSNDDTAFIGSRDLPRARPAYELLPWPVVRVAVGAVLGGG